MQVDARHMILLFMQGRISQAKILKASDTNHEEKIDRLIHLKFRKEDIEGP